MIFITTQRNQLMIPASSCIFSVFWNEEKSKIRTRMNLSLQTAHGISKYRLRSKKPCCRNWLFLQSSVCHWWVQPCHAGLRETTQMSYTTLGVWGVSLKRRKENKRERKIYRKYACDTTFKGNEFKICQWITLNFSAASMLIHSTYLYNSRKMYLILIPNIFYLVLQLSDENIVSVNLWF